MDMPKLTPIPIKTLGRSAFARLWAWGTEIRTWELVEDWEYDLTERTKIIIPKGFVFDGASIPRPLWGLLSPTGLLLIPSLIHDFVYRFDYIWMLSRKGYVYKGYDGAGQEFWDKIFYDVSEKVNGIKAINIMTWVVLSLMGKFSWNENRNRSEPDIFPNKPIQADMHKDILFKPTSVE